MQLTKFADLSYEASFEFSLIYQFAVWFWFTSTAPLNLSFLMVKIQERKEGDRMQKPQKQK